MATRHKLQKVNIKAFNNKNRPIKKAQAFQLNIHQVDKIEVREEFSKQAVSTKNTTAHNPSYPQKHRTFKRTY